VSPYVRDLIDRTVAGKETDYDRVAAIQALFRDASNGFTYNEDATAPGFDEAGALERFLKGKQGFCEQYASAMGAMVRALGIPARVAVGFTPGSRRADGTYEVTTSDAHAWPEVWFSGTGWVRFEPTPRDSQVTTPSYTQPADEAPVAEQPAPASAAPQAPASAAPANPRPEDREDFDTSTTAAKDEGLSGRDLTALLVAVAVLAVLALRPALARLRQRRRWSSRAAVGLGTGLRRRGRRGPHLAPGRLAAGRGSAPGCRPHAAGGAVVALDRLAAAAERARYARPGSGDAGSGTLRADARVVRGALLAGASPRQRWVARLAPPSTLRWATPAWDRPSRTGWTAFDTAVSAVGERVRHPRRPAPAPGQLSGRRCSAAMSPGAAAPLHALVIHSTIAALTGLASR
jgi:hypothetical protein